MMTETECPRRGGNRPGAGHHLLGGDDVAERTCSVEGCEKPLVARGWCRMHYARWWVSDAPKPTPPSVEERFWAKVDKNGPIPEHRPELGPCWLWTATRSPGGYGMFWTGDYSAGTGRMTNAQRVAWEFDDGPIPPGQFVCHHCDNPPCVRRSHLFLGSSRTNNADRHAKGRTVVPDNRGERSAHAKLQEADVIAIRRDVASGMRQREVAERYGTTPGNVSHIVLGDTWRHAGGFIDLTRRAKRDAEEHGSA